MAGRGGVARRASGGDTRSLRSTTRTRDRKDWKKGEEHSSELPAARPEHGTGDQQQQQVRELQPRKRAGDSNSVAAKRTRTDKAKDQAGARLSLHKMPSDAKNEKEDTSRAKAGHATPPRQKAARATRRYTDEYGIEFPADTESASGSAVEPDTCASTRAGRTRKTAKSLSMLLDESEPRRSVHVKRGGPRGPRHRPESEVSAVVNSKDCSDDETEEREEEEEEGHDDDNDVLLLNEPGGFDESEESAGEDEFAGVEDDSDDHEYHGPGDAGDGGDGLEDDDDDDDDDDEEEEEGSEFDDEGEHEGDEYEDYEHGEGIAEESRILGDSIRGELRNAFGFSGFLFGLGGNQMTRKVLALRSAEPYEKLSILQELTQMLSISTEDAIVNDLPMEVLVRELVDIFSLDDEDDVFRELMHTSCLCMSNLVEILPPTTHNLVQGGAIPVLCQKLMDPQYIDMAEQSLKILERISLDYPSMVVQEGGLQGCLAFLDFFHMSVQRRAVTMAANCCRRIPQQCFSATVEVMPKLLDILQSSDRELVEQASICVSRIIESFKADSSKMESIATEELLRTILLLLTQASSRNLSAASQASFLKLLGSITKRLPNSALALFRMNILEVLVQLFTGVSTAEEAAQSEIDRETVQLQIMTHQSQQHVIEALNFISDFLPGLAPEGSEDKRSEMSERRLSQYRENKQRIELLTQAKEEKSLFISTLLPILINLYTSTVSTTVRQRVINALLKLVINIEDEDILNVLNNIPFGSFLAEILSHDIWSPPGIAALQLAENLLKKSPKYFYFGLLREGVIRIVKDLFRYEKGDETDHGLYNVAAPTRIQEQSYVDAAKEKAGSFLKVFESCDAKYSARFAKVSNIDKLQNISRKLGKCRVTDQTYDAFVHILFKRDTVTGFELYESGLIHALVEFLRNASLDQKRVFCKKMSARPSEDDSKSAFTILVERLQILLSHTETFELFSSCGEDSKRSPVNLLTRMLRVKLVAEEDSKIPEPFKEIMFSVHAIATFDAIGNYLRPRLIQRLKAQSKIRSGQNSTSRRDRYNRATAASPIHSSADIAEGGFESESELDKLSLRYEFQGCPVSDEDTLFSLLARDTQGFRVSWSSPIQVKYRLLLHDQDSSSESEDNVNVPPATERDAKINANFEIVLVLMKELFDLSTSDMAARVSPIAFLNSKLTAKLNQQLEDPLVVASACLPEWTRLLTRDFFFLFPFETRYLYLQSTSFGYSRSISRWQRSKRLANSSQDEQLTHLGRLQRQKVRISRHRILDYASQVFDLYASSPSVIEVEYFDEVGTGLGPTLEFYASVSQEFCKTSIGLWRTSGTRDEYVHQANGLFPHPYTSEFLRTARGEKVLGLFRTLGRLVGRSLLDSRIIDIRLNPLMFSDSITPSISLIRQVDSALSDSMLYLKRFVDLWDNGDTSPCIDGVSVEDMSLYFTLPGYPGIELKPHGADCLVTANSLKEYLDLIVGFTVGQGVSEQLAQFRVGFSDVLPFDALRSFRADELVSMFGKGNEDWTIKTLRESVRAEHGYTLESPAIHLLLEIMSEFDEQERREFLQFITGAPRLPIGGFKDLIPALTIVCKPAESPLTSDDYLPSVMTCVNYLKLPSYSSKERMKQRLKVAMRDGQGSFHLS